MNSIAPMSRPRVGCSAISSGASCASSRATTTFWRFPPESDPTGCRLAPDLDPEALDEAPRARRNGPVVDERTMSERGPAMETHREIVRRRGL